jgi:hypothetical protein
MLCYNHFSTIEHLTKSIQASKYLGLLIPFLLHSFSRQIFKSQSVHVTNVQGFLPTTSSFKHKLYFDVMSVIHFLNKYNVVGSGQPEQIFIKRFTCVWLKTGQLQDRKTNWLKTKKTIDKKMKPFIEIVSTPKQINIEICEWNYLNSLGLDLCLWVLCRTYLKLVPQLAWRIRGRRIRDHPERFGF